MDFQGCFSSSSSCGQTQSSPPLPPPSAPPYGTTTHAFFPSRSSLPDDHISFSCPLPRSPSSSCIHYRSRSDAITEDYYDGNKDSKNDDVFLISSKEASLERLRRWRQATLALNAVRRFRYTTDLGREAELDIFKQEAIKRLRAGTTAIRAIQRFKAAASLSNEVKEEEEEEATEIISPPPEGFGVSAATLTSMMKNQDREILGRLGGPTGVAKSLRSDLKNGLNSHSEEMQTRTKAFGANAFPRKPSKSLLVFFWEAFQDPTLAILMVCAALSLGFGMRSHGPKEGWYDGASIAFAVILVVLITAISDFNQFQQFKELGKEKQNIHLHVLREGRRPKISIYELVVGDVVPINTGDQVPADGLLIHGHQLSVDESSITGESEHVVIDRKHPFLLSGSKVVDGYGLMLVVSVGTSTEWGSIMSSISSDVGEETPLQVRLNGVATFIGKMGLAVAVSVFIVLMSFYFTGHRNGSDGRKFKAGHTKASAAVNSVVDIFSIAVTIIVVAVPEGLPLAVTLTLAYSMKKMMADRALVRRLSSCETMGSATTICSDKTGTLTLNEMTVVKACIGGEIVEPPNNFLTLSLHVKTLLLEGITYNTSGSVFIPVESGGEMEIIGSPTEKAILRWGLKSGMNYEGLKSEGTILHVESFNSESKRAGVAVKAKESGRIYVHWKGAAEIILGLCDKSLTADGSVVVMGEEKRAELLSVIEGMAASSLRCVAFACKEVTETTEMNGEALAEAWRMPESELTLVAIVGIKDPCRPEVREAVRRCQVAGVEVRMVTGDNLLTAKAIAAECGILQDGYCAIEGRDFRALTPEERKRQVSKICILARSSPMDKLLLVKTLKEIGHVVGVTGDGTNDAPALHAADVGLSMGIQGTEVAKESSDIIILDDNFSSVVKVVCWGRSVYANIQKFIQFQLTVNVAALSVNFVAAISSGSVPLTTVQLLWVNLIMDTLGALALATEPPNEDLMRRPPVGRRDPLITKLMWLHILSQAGYQITILLTLQFIGKPLLGLSGSCAEVVKNTMIFNSFVFCQIFNEVNARRPSKLNIFEGVFKNRLFVGIVVSTAVAQVLIVEFLEKFASTTKLNGQQWLICLGLAFISWPIAFAVKFLPIQRLNNTVNMQTC